MDTPLGGDWLINRGWWLSSAVRPQAAWRARLLATSRPAGGVHRGSRPAAFVWPSWMAVDIQSVVADACLSRIGVCRASRVELYLLCVHKDEADCAHCPKWDCTVVSPR